MKPVSEINLQVQREAEQPLLELIAEDISPSVQPY
jgi:hypothetical protein